MENSYHQTTRRNFLNQLGLAAAGMTTGNTALAATQYDSGIPRNSVPDRTSDNSAKRVIMISLDGICVEGFQKAHAPSLKGMMSQGAFSLDTRVVMPSVTLPNWTSHLTGSGPEQHGVFNNNWTPAKSSYPAVRRDEDGYYPSVFQALKKCQPSCKTAFYYNWKPLAYPFNEKYLDQISIEKIEQVYRDRIKDASDFTFFIVGNIDTETVKPLVEKYIGSLKSENRKETWRDNHVRGPKGKTVKEIELELTTPKSSVITNFSKDMKYSVYNNICNNILEGILDLRYTENIREKEGGTYGVGVQAGSVREPYSNYSMTMSFDCDPDKAQHLKSLIYAELDKIMKEAPTPEEMNKVIANMKKNHEQSKNHNSYWMNCITSYYISGVNPNDPKNFDHIVDKLQPKDIQKFAQSLFKGADVVDLIFKPKQ